MNKRLIISILGTILISLSFVFPIIIGPPSITMIDVIEYNHYIPFVIASYLVAVFSVGISVIPKRVPIISSRFFGIVVGLIAVGSGIIVYNLLSGTYGLGIYAWVSGNFLFLLGSLFRIPNGKESGTVDTDV